MIDAARALLGSEDATEFTVDQVAQRAGVSRMTVYYQFRGRSGLLEALLDDLGSRSGMERIPEAMRRDDAKDALVELVRIFTHFWASQRRIIRRLRALAVLDPELAGVFRDDRRGQILHVLLAKAGVPSQRADETLDVLQMLTSFETYEALASAERSHDEVHAIIERLVLMVWTQAVSSGMSA